MEEGGNILRSLNVKLLDGNILNAVRFKLLIPETRYNIHEFLGTVILREFVLLHQKHFRQKLNLITPRLSCCFKKICQKN